jgi:hypothetical protein
MEAWIQAHLRRHLRWVPFDPRRERKESIMSLITRYLGLTLKNPMIASGISADRQAR